MIIIFDLLVLELLYEDAYDIYISNNKQTSLCKSASVVQVLFACAERAWSVCASVLTFDPAVRGHIGYVVKLILR